MCAVGADEIDKNSQEEPDKINVCQWMRSSRVARASDSQYRSRDCPGFDPSILRHSEIWGEADEAVLNKVLKK